ncbi:MAG: hypothetical protein WAV92_04290 [Halopseudomonas yangmingensis]|uniref:Uncharacterized protein n=1 Tax=Halopseudomonas yangmingensis TaxID=1720063 RepID=A0A1I4TFQ8_9GAMM|nr:hypothetical protein [Halopseudomonas yangmingensis]SFM75463.1 hypothetical protein SAMN05216217_11427 [Halopseudomonas yangmingensis]
MSQDSVAERFNRPGIAHARFLYREFAFQLDGIPELIRLRLYRRLGENWFEVEQSHYLQTPGMALPAMPDSAGYDNEQAALDEVLGQFSETWQAATKAGHDPDADWLLPNRDFH